MRIHLLFTPPHATVVTGEVTGIDMDMRSLSVVPEGSTEACTFKVRECGLLQSVENGDKVRVDSADNKTADAISKI